MLSSRAKAFVARRKKATPQAVKSDAQPSWVGLISIGGINVPVGAFIVTKEPSSVLMSVDTRDMNPTGMRPYNKVTGLNLKRDLIGRGIASPDGSSVLIDPAALTSVFPKTTRVLSVESAVKMAEISPAFFSRSYILRPVGGFHKGYVVLLASLRAARLGALGRVVVATTQHMAVLAPEGEVLMMHLLRWPSNVEAPQEFPSLPLVTDSELLHGKRLLKSLAKPFSPGLAAENFTEKLVRFAELAKPGGSVAVADGEDLPVPTADTDLDVVLKAAVKKPSVATRPGTAKKSTPSVPRRVPGPIKDAVRAVGKARSRTKK